MSLASAPREIFRPDPILGWALTPGTRVHVSFRPGLVQHIGSDGWRQGPSGCPTGQPTLAVYGCSFTFGTSLADDETYVAKLQLVLPELHVVNRGIGGHGTLQNYLSFRRDLSQGRVAAAVFGVISDHRFRNLAHPQRMRQYRAARWYERGIEHVPVARQGRGGELIVDYLPIWQPAASRDDFHVFVPNDYMVDQATVCVFQAIAALAEQHQVPVLFALLDQLDPDFNGLMLRTFSATIDVSTPFDPDHTFVPKDIHPNPRANRLFADRLVLPVRELCARARRGRS